MEKKALFTSHVLFFVSNISKSSKVTTNYYDIYTKLRNKFNGLFELTIDDIDNFLNDIDEKFYIKELPYQFELYNVASECVFCINRPHSMAKELNKLVNTM